MPSARGKDRAFTKAPFVNEQRGLLKSEEGLAASLLLGVVAVIAVVIIAAIGGWAGWWRLGRSGTTWVWWALTLIVAGGIIAAIVGSVMAVWGFMPRYLERRFLARLHSGDERAPESEGEASYRELRDKMLEAIRTIEMSPDLRKKGGLALYTVPWYLLLGAGRSGKTALLQGVASSFAPFAHPFSNSDSPTQNCDWWFFNTAIILDTTGRYALPTQAERDSAEWYRLLRLLRDHRGLLPINGLMTTVAADTLVSKRPEELRLDAAELRKRIDEAIRELGVNFPIYLLVTKCDLLEGFTEFFACLPEQTLRQVFGHVNDTQLQAENEQAQVTSMLRFESKSEGIVERLKQVRLSIFNEEKLPPATLRQKIFCFPEEFRALQQPLRTFVETLLADNPFQHRPFFRGLFFTSAQQQGTPSSFLRRQLHFDSPTRPVERGTKPYFLHDLFAVVLRRDQPLARRTRRAIRIGLFKHLFGLGGAVAFCILFLILLFQAFRSDQAIHASVNQEACDPAGGRQGARPFLEQAEGCRQVVQALIDQDNQRFVWSKLIFNRSGRLADRLRRRYVEKFASEVLTPLDTGIDQHLIAGPEAIPLVLLLVKRTELINRCLSAFGCPDPIDDDLRPEYQRMLDPGGRLSPAPGQVAMLQNTYETYLHWSSESLEPLRREQEAHADRLRRWFGSKQFAPRQILLWANQAYAPVTSQTFWEGFPPADGKRALQVDGAYTEAAWKQSILPFLRRVGEAVPEVESLLSDFQARYRAQYFEQWERFVAEFPRSELPWSRTREHRRLLAVKLLEANSPYNRVLDVAYNHLKPLLPTALPMESSPTDVAEGNPSQQPPHLLLRVWRTVSQFWGKGGKKEAHEERSVATAIDEPTIPAWARVLQRYIKSDGRKLYLESLKQIREQLTGDSALEKSFQLAQAGFKEGTPTDKSTHPVLRARWIISQIREKQGSGAESEDKAFWPLLERPVSIAWKVILEGTGEFLQKSWAENVVAPTKGLSKLEQANILYGPQGKVRQFVNQFVSPFLADNESRPVRILGEEVTLPPNILGALQEAKQLGPILELKTPQRVRVDAARDSAIDSHTSLLEDKTEFLLECEAKSFKINNRSKDRSEASTTVFWSSEGCGDVTISVYVSCGKACVERAAAVGIPVPEASALRIVKRYPGQAGFLQFIRDFRGGSQAFGMSDLPEAEEALRRYRINSIRVFYRLEVPDTLWKLMSLVPK